MNACETCDATPMRFCWTDTHGVAQCSTCGTPYRLYHYGEDGKFQEAPPSSEVKDSWKPRLRQYWNEEHCVIPSGYSFPGGQELASREDHERFYTWCKKNVGDSD